MCAFSFVYPRKVTLFISFSGHTREADVDDVGIGSVPWIVTKHVAASTIASSFCDDDKITVIYER